MVAGLFPNSYSAVPNSTAGTFLALSLALNLRVTGALRNTCQRNLSCQVKIWTTTITSSLKSLILCRNVRIKCHIGNEWLSISLQMDGEGLLNDELPNCWECPKCYKGDETEKGQVRSEYSAPFYHRKASFCYTVLIYMERLNAPFFCTWAFGEFRWLWCSESWTCLHTLGRLSRWCVRSHSLAGEHQGELFHWAKYLYLETGTVDTILS